MSHVVTITRVASPFGRGSVFSANGHSVRSALRLTEARYLPRSAFETPLTSRRGGDQYGDFSGSSRPALYFSLTRVRPAPDCAAVPSGTYRSLLAITGNT